MFSQALWHLTPVLMPAADSQPSSSTSSPLSTSSGLDQVLSTLSPNVGLYAKETLMSLASALLQWHRQQPDKGWVISHLFPETPTTNNDWELLLTPLKACPHLNWLALTEDIDALGRNSFILMGTAHQLSALVWQADGRRALSTYTGGWTINAGETLSLVEWVTTQQPSIQLPPLLHQQRQDPKSLNNGDSRLSGLLTSLVRGLESQNKALMEANDSLIRLNKQMVDQERLAAIGQLCSVVAHEIRNPLGLIELYAKLVEGQLAKVLEDSNATQHPAVETIHSNLAMVSEAVQGLEVILSELTQYSRPLEIEPTITAVAPYVRSICQFYQPKYDEKGVQLILNTPESLEKTVFANIDAPRIRQALINLLKNALEASPKGTAVTVTVASRQNDHDIYIKVADQGSGVSDHAKSKLFTPYFSTKGNGTGLGLAHSQKILQAHGGRVALLSSVVGSGSTFAIILPRQHDVTPESLPA